MQAIVFKCRNNSQFRIGEGSLTDVSDIIHSDTVFSAIANLYELVFKQAEKFINFVNDEKVIFSSCFPLIEDVKNSKYLFFLPKPLIEYTGICPEKDKNFKKINYISIGVLNDISSTIDKNTLTSNMNLLDEKEYTIIGEKFCCKKSEIINDLDYTNIKIISEIISPKTSVHKKIQEDTFYYESNLQILYIPDKNDNTIYKTHFYFLLNDNLSDEDKKDFIAILRILADEGIGGQRSQGKGLFDDIEVIDFKLHNNESDLSMLISVLNPASAEEFNNLLSYDILFRGGGSLGQQGEKEYHRKQVRMIKEGAVIKGIVKGRLLDVTPKNNIKNTIIYRNGKCFPISLGGIK